MHTLAAVIALSCFGCSIVESSSDEPPQPQSDSLPQPPAGQPVDSTAHRYFDAHVYPLLMERCGVCHADQIGSIPGFIDSDATQAYDRITQTSVVGDYSIDAPIVNLGSHQNLEWSVDELETLHTWLAFEREGL